MSPARGDGQSRRRASRVLGIREAARSPRTRRSGKLSVTFPLVLTTLALGLAGPLVGTAAAVNVPRDAQAVDTSRPDRWVGTGTPRSCTSRAVVRAVARGGVIRFRCGPAPVRIVMRQTAKVVNTSRRVVLDGARPGHAQRRREAPDPLPGHLRPAADLDHVALRRPGHASSGGAEPDASRTATPPARRMTAAVAVRYSPAAVS